MENLCNYLLKRFNATHCISYLFQSKSKSVNPSTEKSLQLKMPIDVYRVWFNALKEDNADAASVILSSAATVEKSKLLNGSFDFTGSEFSVGDVLENGLRKPLSVCVFYNAFNVLLLFLKYNVILEDPDTTTGDNILHVLVKRTLLKPCEEASAIETYKYVIYKLA